MNSLFILKRCQTITSSSKIIKSKSYCNNERKSRDQRKSFMRIMWKTAAEPFTKPPPHLSPVQRTVPHASLGRSLSGKQNAPAESDTADDGTYNGRNVCDLRTLLSNVTSLNYISKSDSGVFSLLPTIAVWKLNPYLEIVFRKIKFMMRSYYLHCFFNSLQ